LKNLEFHSLVQGDIHRHSVTRMKPLQNVFTMRVFKKIEGISEPLYNRNRC